ncbi:EF-hand domain-containing protein [Thalassomonas actiniarum]|uniref:EF-hand domain-containing protein n=1 Tax=Thalassomonas actiniarum TaxID=485447 RepID=A0AAE9YR92_9GAMM|nr:EF-hand domain-containing protein [Thalassomonas actiniarum]WDD98087.1 EF-hand domain-containing protein [Thalassomonas actiniarum]
MKAIKLFMTLSLATAAFSLTTAANATQAKDNFSQLDSDKNGMISMGEASGDTELTNNFKQWDKDRDGQLSKEEYTAYIQAS